MALNSSREDKKADSHVRTRILVVAAIILIITFFAVYRGGKKIDKEDKTVTQGKADSGQVAKTGPGATSVMPVADTASPSNHKGDSTVGKPVEKRHPYPGYVAVKSKAKVDSAKVKAAADSAKAFQASADSAEKALAVADSVKAAAAAVDSAKTPKTADTGAVDSDAVLFGSNAPADCANDTVVPWVYPEPSGGLFHGPLSIRFSSNKKCSISWRTGADTVWQRYDDKALPVDKTMTFFFKATDRCGRDMKERQEYYEIERSASGNVCPQGMDLVKIGSMRFCIDRYEWPNRKGALPQSYVTLYQAKDSCFVAGKRLCSSEEWSLACSGPYSWKYPYGKDYESRACITADTVARASGSKPECRAFFGSFDMSGNLLEWTGTVSRGSPGFFNVLGGFWQSGVRSSCFDIRSSYFPQNRHNPVGFRCCKDVPEGK